MPQQLPPRSPAAHSPVHGSPSEVAGAASSLVDFPALIAAHHAALYRYAYRLCGCAAEADDLTQQTFLVSQQRLHQLREADRAGAWLFAVLRSCFLKSIRRQRPVSAAALDLEVDQFADQSPVADEIDREQLAAALADLPEEFRLVVLMFYFEELSYQEIAEQLEIPIGTVMSRLSRAKGHLRRRLTVAGGKQGEASSRDPERVVSPLSRENIARDDVARDSVLREHSKSASLRSTKPIR